jgi:predicted DNA-binding transcriptional regulator YafY
MTARDLADELEVSERTIYRDIDALCVAGVPVYSDSGHHGGYALLENYQTNLTGLTKDELRALFMLGNLLPLADLGLSKELRSALLKISASSPQSSREDDELIQQCFYFDPLWWQQTDSRVPHLEVVQEAVWNRIKLNIVYRTFHPLEIRSMVAPYGLVAKAGTWHLVAARKESIHVYRVSDLLDARLSNETFDRPPNFDLHRFWDHWREDYEAQLSDFKATVRVAPSFIPILPRYFGYQIEKKISQAGPPDSEGWLKLELAFESFNAARDRILGFGRGVEVLAPQALQKSVCDYAEQIVNLYKH